MTTAAELLKLIEQADPKDEAGLYEIDARVWCFINGETFKEDFQGRFKISVPLGKHAFRRSPEYTRSRDALKAIRPEFFEVTISNNEIDWQCTLDKGDVCHESPHLPTEELAELHAIIQAIEWERNQ